MTYERNNEINKGNKKTAFRDEQVNQTKESNTNTGTQ